MTADNDNPPEPIPPRTLYGYLRPGSDEVTFYEREMIERRREAVPLPKADDA
ncbi:hypothetical protein [Phenylobacterium immobile]|uniref:hypothetical protein n=1 Tax=Phenylobacterium immobile TaxID=21 RepID=UPI000AC78F31|nr:hypothetical protein [Phenylobacterium immobile]